MSENVLDNMDTVGIVGQVWNRTVKTKKNREIKKMKQYQKTKKQFSGFPMGINEFVPITTKKNTGEFIMINLEQWNIASKKQSLTDEQIEIAFAALIESKGDYKKAAINSGVTESQAKNIRLATIKAKDISTLKTKEEMLKALENVPQYLKETTERILELSGKKLK